MIATFRPPMPLDLRHKLISGTVRGMTQVDQGDRKITSTRVDRADKLPQVSCIGSTKGRLHHI
jgi:hypothetical protein